MDWTIDLSELGSSDVTLRCIASCRAVSRSSSSSVLEMLGLLIDSFSPGVARDGVGRLATLSGESLMPLASLSERFESDQGFAWIGSPGLTDRFT